MGTPEPVSDLLQTSQEYLDGKTNANQALTNFVREVQSAYGKEHDLRALFYESDVQASGVNQKPKASFSCADSDTCHFVAVPSILDFSAVPGRKIEITANDKDRSANIEVGHMSGNDFVVDAQQSVKDTFFEKAKAKLIFPDRNYFQRVTKTEGGTAVDGLAQLDRMAQEDPEQCERVTALTLTSNRYNDGIALHDLKGFPNLKGLQLDIYFADKDLKYLKLYGSKIESLSLGYNDLDGPGLATLSEMPNLKTLDLGLASINGAALQHLDSPTLTSLNLGNEMSNDGFKSLAKLPNLKQLQLNQGNYTIDGLNDLAASKSLEHLVINFPRNVSASNIESLQKMMPKVRIDYNVFPQD